MMSLKKDCEISDLAFFEHKTSFVITSNRDVFFDYT